MTLRDCALIRYARRSTMPPSKIARVVEAADKAGEWDKLVTTTSELHEHLEGVMARHGAA